MTRRTDYADEGIGHSVQKNKKTCKQTYTHCFHGHFIGKSPDEVKFDVDELTAVCVRKRPFLVPTTRMTH